MRRAAARPGSAAQVTAMPHRLATLSLTLLLLAGLGLLWWTGQGAAAPQAAAQAGGPAGAAAARPAGLLHLTPAERAARFSRLFQE